jgi:hypothetical protein
MFSLKTHDVYQEIQIEKGSLAGHHCYIARLYERDGTEVGRIVGSRLTRREAINDASAELNKQFNTKYPRIN